ncbi:MAG: hypothetical protein SA339_03875 [Methanomassiliicoccus sp.]|nr:hypothetical protein [Methanomassiliicoccus sp.]
MSGRMRIDPINGVSMIAAIVLALGAVLCIVKRDIYWTVVAVWSFTLITVPFIRYRDRERSSIGFLILLVLPPFLLSFMDGSEASGILPLNSIWYLMLSTTALFALTIVTVAFINSVSGMELNLKFAMQVAFMLYTSLVAMQAVVFYYSDLWLGTTIIGSNNDLMVYVALATIVGLFLTIAFYALARTNLTKSGARLEEGAGD